MARTIVKGKLGREGVAAAIWARLDSQTKWELLALGMREFGEVSVGVLADRLAERRRELAAFEQSMARTTGLAS